MFGKKLTIEDLEELKKKEEHIRQYISVAQALEVQKQLFIKRLMPKYGLDMNENYTIDLKSGKIVKAKPPQTPQ